MAKATDYILDRYYHIIKWLQQKSYTISDLQSKLGNKITERQIRNNINEIRDNYKIDIQKDTKGNYWIESISEKSQKFIEMFSMVHFSIKLFEDEENSNFVQLERVNFVQQNNLDGLLEACKNRNIISLQYENFWWDNIEFVIEPYLLKQFRNRWYLIAKITKIIKAEHQNTRVTEGDIYNFSLDRILNIDNTKNTFKDPNFDANKFYKDCFGILTPFSQDNEQVQEVVLCFEKIQGKYIKRLPLHHSQRIFKATKDHIFVRLKLYITYDFVQEILHFGETVKVISPQFFKEKIMKEVSNQIVKYYDENDELPSRSDIY